MEDFNSKYTGQQVEDLLDQVASGNAGGGGDITEVYITDFTMESLINGMNNGTQVACDMQALVTAMNANKIILVREAEDSYYKGVYVLNGYIEDYLYFSIVSISGDILWCDGTDYISSSYIDSRSLRLRDWDNNQDKLISGENIKTFNGESLLGEGDITTPTFLRIGDTDDEAKANFIAVANREKSADYYICSSRVQNTLIHGIATKLGESGPTNSPVYVRYDIYGNTTSGELGGKLLKITTKLTTATGEITTTYEAILDAKQDTITDLANIREGASKGITSVQPSDISDFITIEDVAAVATSGSYNDLTNKPTIPSAVTESTVSGWGFTKNTGTYSKPSGGIPKSDLNSTVQTSLNKADSSAQTYIVNFDILQLLSGEEILDDGGDVLRRAVEDHKLILIPLEKVSPAFGYLPMSVYAEDGIYFSVVYDTKIISGVVWDNEQELRVEDVIIEDVSQKQDKIKFETGGLSFITASGLNAENADVNVVLPSDANGEEDDILLTRDSVKTINGESIFGSGDITIEGGGGSSGGGGKEYVVVEPNFSPMGAEINISNIEPNKTYIVSEPIILLHINRFGTTEAVCDEYNVIFKAKNGDTALTIVNVDYLFWVNGTIPTMEEGAVYELSIQRVRISGIDIYNAVLTPFKPV